MMARLRMSLAMGEWVEAAAFCGRALYYSQAYRKAFCAYDSLWRFGRRCLQHVRLYELANVGT